MIKRKKAIVFEAFARILLMIIAIWVVFNVGKLIAQAAGIGRSNIGEEFDRLVNQINELKAGDVNHIFVTLDSNTAMVGFSKSSTRYECYNCGTEKNGLTSFFKKPDKAECNGKACICLCNNWLSKDTPEYSISNIPYELKCDGMKCLELKEGQDLAGVTELKLYFEEISKTEPQKYDKLMSARWEGGFMLERHSRGDFVTNALPSSNLRRFTVFIDKEQRGDIIFTTVCPGFDCSSKYKSENIGVSDICSLISKCVRPGMNLPKIVTTGEPMLSSECPRQYKASFYYENDCNEVKNCVSKDTNSNINCNKAGIYYILTFSNKAS